jgi:septal ring factor EnvC (AmiA/AmiB activator)
LTFGSTGSGGKHSHEALNTQVWLHCQNEVISGTVNFVSRVTSNLENSRNGQKMGDDKIMDRLSKILGAGFMASSLLFVSTPAFAADGEIKSDLRELHQDHREIRGDRRELRGDFKELKGDRRELRGDIKSGAGDTEIAQDRKEIRGDRHQLRRDHRERRGDRREIHGDRRELRRDINDSKASN